MKKSKIIIDTQPEMSAVSLIEEGVLNEYYIEYGHTELLTGNIYKGRVVNVLSGLQSAFVDIGREKNGFLFAAETLEDRQEIFGEGLPQRLNVKEGETVMVQVTKEETENKGARLSCYVSLPGRLLVYLPQLNFLGVSNKISEPSVRERLSGWIEKIKTPQEGFIARTCAASCTKKELLDEAKQLKALYESIQERFSQADDPCQIHSEGNLLVRTVRDMLRAGVESVICSNPETALSLRGELQSKGWQFADAVRHFESGYDIIDEFGISRAVDKLLEKKVELQNGGSLIIERTEALTAIDVNTAKFKAAESHEETVFLVNAEAAKEIARQIRLRNIGGIIVVDFIDMQSPQNREKIVELLRSEVSSDRIKTRVLDMTGLGLVELTRKKIGLELVSFLLEPCPHCKGGEQTHSALWVARKIKAALKRLFTDQKCSSALVTCAPNVLNAVFAHRFFAADCETVWREKRIYMIPNHGIKPHIFSVSGSNAVSLNLPNDAKLLY
ncbi:MAG: Rne/Rng family ribonuclease [Firmicutes bacterium]|nr:Rne/Rng family ribonuclease [Bacillota bacterium]